MFGYKAEQGQYRYTSTIVSKLYSTHMPITVQKLTASNWVNLLGLKILNYSIIEGWFEYAQVLLIKPNLSLFLWNYSLLSTLVTMSAICLSVAQKLIQIRPFSTLSLKKWWRMSMCNIVLFLGCPRYQTKFKKVSHTWGAFSLRGCTVEPLVWPYFEWLFWTHPIYS